LIAACPRAAKRPAVFAEGLGMLDERIERGSLGDLAKLSCGALSTLLLLPCEEPFDEGLPLGLPDSEFVCEGRMMTHPELHAVAISKLRLGPGVMWDVGAGSGSVGIEASQLARGLEVFAIEKDAGRLENIRRNAASSGAASLEIVEGLAPAAFAGLPRPRSVFIGGGGSALPEIFEAAWEALLPGGTLVAVGALLETRAALTRLHPEACEEVVSISISRSSPLLDSRLMKAENPSDLFVYRKPCQEPS
jgi:precorrin-6Y C5,15-methyltransferase (decarboxylating)